MTHILDLQLVWHKTFLYDLILLIIYLSDSSIFFSDYEFEYFNCLLFKDMFIT